MGWSFVWKGAQQSATPDAYARCGATIRYGESRCSQDTHFSIHMGCWGDIEDIDGFFLSLIFRL
jgi:hypothetical protein